MEPQVWITLAIQAFGTCVMVGVFLQQHKEYGRRLAEIERKMIHREVFEAVVEDVHRRLDSLERHQWPHPRRDA